MSRHRVLVTVIWLQLYASDNKHICNRACLGMQRDELPMPPFLFIRRHQCGPGHAAAASAHQPAQHIGSRRGMPGRPADSRASAIHHVRTPATQSSESTPATQSTPATPATQSTESTPTTIYTHTTRARRVRQLHQVHRHTFPARFFPSGGTSAALAMLLRSMAPE